MRFFIQTPLVAKTSGVSFLLGAKLKNKTKTSWQKAWEGCEMDQEVRAAKRIIKKTKVRKNRNSCREALRQGNYDDISVTEWDNLTDKDIV